MSFDNNDHSSSGDRPRREGSDRGPRRDFGGDRGPRREGGDRPPRRDGGFGGDRGPRREGGFGGGSNGGSRGGFGGGSRGGFGAGSRGGFGGPRRDGGFNRGPRRDFGQDDSKNRLIKDEYLKKIELISADEYDLTNIETAKGMLKLAPVKFIEDWYNLILKGLKK